VYRVDLPGWLEAGQLEIDRKRVAPVRREEETRDLGVLGTTTSPQRAAASRG
jgi:hypothetical protein